MRSKKIWNKQSLGKSELKDEDLYKKMELMLAKDAIKMRHKNDGDNQPIDEKELKKECLYIQVSLMLAKTAIPYSEINQFRLWNTIDYHPYLNRHMDADMRMLKRACEKLSCDDTEVIIAAVKKLYSSDILLSNSIRGTPFAALLRFKTEFLVLSAQATLFLLANSDKSGKSLEKEFWWLHDELSEIREESLFKADTFRKALATDEIKSLDDVWVRCKVLQSSDKQPLSDQKQLPDSGSSDDLKPVGAQHAV